MQQTKGINSIICQLNLVNHGLREPNRINSSSQINYESKWLNNDNNIIFHIANNLQKNKWRKYNYLSVHPSCVLYPKLLLPCAAHGMITVINVTSFCLKGTPISIPFRGIDQRHFGIIDQHHFGGILF